MPSGRFCSGEQCTDVMKILNPDHKCVKCKKMVHCECDFFVTGRSNDYMCLLCNKKSDKSKIYTQENTPAPLSNESGNAFKNIFSGIVQLFRSELTIPAKKQRHLCTVKDCNKLNYLVHRHNYQTQRHQPVSTTLQISFIIIKLKMISMLTQN